MTDLTLIKDELSSVMKLDDSEIEDSEQIITAAAQYIFSVLKNKENENDSSIVHLCAARAYYQILLISQRDDITSFKAGDVSFSRASSDLENAQRLYELALEQSSELLNSSGSTNAFAFKAV